MGSFSASLKTLGDRHGLPATITLDRGRLSIDAGEHAIGDWSLDEIHLEATGNGYRIAAEGEQIIIELGDLEGFTNELNAKLRKTRRGFLGSDDRERARKPKRTVEPKPVERVQPRRPITIVETAPKEKETEGGFLHTIDGWLTRAENRWGSLLPSWVFTRIMLALAVVALLITIFLPGLVSLLLLVAGVLLVMLGAVFYTDQVLAARYLPGRMTPMHVLLFGVAVLMFGVLVGVIA